MKDRKILVEVTPKEYENIVAGKLDTENNQLSSYSTKDLVQEIIARSTRAPQNEYNSWMHPSSAYSGRVDITEEGDYGQKILYLFTWTYDRK